MIDFLFWFFYFLPLIVLYFLSKINTFNVFQISIANILVLFYLISNHLGLASIYYNGFIRSGEIAVNYHTLFLLTVYNNIVVLIFILTGILIPKPRRLKTNKNEKLNLFPIIIILPVLLFFSIYKYLNQSPLQLLLSGDVQGATVERISQVSENRTSILGIKHSYIQILFEICIYIIILLLSSYYIHKRRILIVLASIFLIILIIFNISNVAKGIFLFVFYYFIFVHAQFRNNGNLFNKNFVIHSILFSVILAYISFWVLGSMDVDFLYPFQRLVLGNLEPQYVIVNYFGFHNLLFGASAPTFLSFGNHTQVDLTFFAWQLLGLGNDLDGLSYTAPFSFVGEAHANFHIFGVVFLSLIVFTVFRFLDLVLMKVKSSLTYFSLLIYISLHYSYMSVTGFFPYFIDYYLWGVLIFIFIIYPNSRIRDFQIKILFVNQNIKN
jgi:hypothetical protein